MRKRSIRGWKNTIFSLVLALAIILEPPMLSLAANDQTVTEKSATEESKTEEGSESEEKEEETEEESESEEKEEGTEDSESEKETDAGEGSESEEKEEETEEGSESEEKEEETEEESESEEKEEETEEETTTEETELAEENINSMTSVLLTSSEADFVVSSDGVLTSYTGKATEVKIPDGVTKIAAYVFQNNKEIESVTCPDSLQIIGEYAFSGCTGLREVTLNKGLTTIGGFAFQNVGFGGKTSTQAIEYGTLTVPSTVSEIGARAFKGSEYLGEVVFENGDTQSISYTRNSYYHDMFEGCKNLKKVTLPDRATEIPYGAFMNCTALEEVVSLGANVETIADHAFQNCVALKKITCPSSLKSIGEEAFNGCTGLREVTLNKGLTTIGGFAFQNVGFGGKTSTQAIEYGTLTVPSTVSEIGARAFKGSEYLGEVVFENGDTQSISYTRNSYYHDMFEGCKNLKKVTLPDRATEIPYGAFMNCTALEEVVSLGANVETIADHAFQNCVALKKITCPSSLKSIGVETFSGCTGLMEAQLNEGLGTIGDRAFERAGFGGKTSTQATVYGTITIPSTVYSIGTSAFSGCTYLEEVFFLNGETVSMIFNTGTFQNCNNLKKVYLPERLSELPIYTFYNCTSLNTLYIPKGVESINKDAVARCDFKKLVIYGEPQSAAEAFAKQIGVPFNNRTELGIYANPLS